MNTAEARELSKTNSPVPLLDEHSAASHAHSVQFYEDDAFLIEGLSRFVGAALVAGDSALVIATQVHRDALEELLRGGGLDLNLAIKEGRYLSLDAAQTLSQFMVNGQPDTSRFALVVGGVISQLASAARGKTRRVFAFGEMVYLLCLNGKAEAAVQLEQFWNRLAQTHAFHLHCAYPMDFFSKKLDGELIQQICAEHSRVIPSERYTALGNDNERFRTVTLLQQKAEALESEARERKKIQKALEERESELSDFLENAVVGMHWVSADGRILWANKAELALLGYESEEYIGHHISEFHADPDVIADILQRLSHNEELHAYEARLKRKDGAICDVRIDSSVFMRDGRFVHMRCFTIDLSEAKQAEQAALRLAAIVESSDDAIVSKDLNGVVTSWNKSAQRIFGYTAEEMVGKPITLIIPPELRSDEQLILSKIRAGERVDHFETVRVKKNGERLHVSLTVSPVKDREGKIVGAAKVARDITEQKKRDAALRTSERLASVGRLAATVAHEINNPLEAVTNFIYLARLQPDLSEKLTRYLSSADQELARVSHIAQQTLGFYRDNSRPVSLVISDVIEDVLTIYERKFQYKELHVERRIESGLTAYTLQGELKQIISNLVANAIDASSAHGKIVIEARASRDFRSGRAGTRITVADNGVGISNQNKAKIFAPFFTTKREVGTGLGLWITKDLLERKGGHIRFRSSDAKRPGTVMSIFLPEESSVAAAKLIA